MTASLVCVVEEPSAAEMLQAVLPRLLPPGWKSCFVVFEGKRDLEKNIEKRLRGWRDPNACFLVMRDQDADDCRKIKKNLMLKATRSGKGKRTIVRIACHELETFYLGDLQAVEKGLNIPGLSKLQSRRAYRTPDRLSAAAHELGRLANRHRQNYQKVQGSRLIAPFLRVDGSNASRSFIALIAGIGKILKTGSTGASSI
ncbi:MAG: DUF4276 family protein [Planctomycetota bacterium]|jgi:hypothetical protein|nr:DUF4276 family protein [Planctomycetota bacterium]